MFVCVCCSENSLMLQACFLFCNICFFFFESPFFFSFGMKLSDKNFSNSNDLSMKGRERGMRDKKKLACHLVLLVEASSKLRICDVSSKELQH